MGLLGIIMDHVEKALDEADSYAEINSNRMSHEEVFGKLI